MMRMTIVSRAPWAGVAAGVIRRRRNLRWRIVWTAVALGVIPDIAVDALYLVRTRAEATPEEFWPKPAI